MKNIILSVFSVMLLSCQPSYAEVIDNNLNNTGLQLTLCEEIANYSESVMQARQHNFSYEYVKSLAPTPKTEVEEQVKLILDAITFEAYQLPVVEDEGNKIELSEYFSEQVYLICIGDEYL